MNALAKNISLDERVRPRSVMIRTTLYDLIEAIGEEVKPEEGGLVVLTLAHMLDSGRCRLRGDLESLSELCSEKKKDLSGNEKE